MDYWASKILDETTLSLMGFLGKQGFWAILVEAEQKPGEKGSGPKQSKQPWLLRLVLAMPQPKPVNDQKHHRNHYHDTRNLAMTRQEEEERTNKAQNPGDFP
jgi:hypothetical protein